MKYSFVMNIKRSYGEHLPEIPAYFLMGGMLISERTYNSNIYCYKYQWRDSDNEIYGVSGKAIVDLPEMHVSTSGSGGLEFSSPGHPTLLSETTNQRISKIGFATYEFGNFVTELILEQVKKIDVYDNNETDIDFIVNFSIIIYSNV